MATNSSLLKSALHNSIAEGLYNEIVNKSARYYYFLGKTLAWDEETEPPFPIDSISYMDQTRNEIITMKEIKPTDIAFVIQRINWVSGTVYDMYDDQYSDEIQGIDLISGGYGYADPPTVTITGGGGTGASAQAVIVDGVVIDIELLSRGRGYTSAPSVTITGGGGEGASAGATITKSPSGKQRVEDIIDYVITDEYNVYKCLDNNRGALSTYKPVGTTVDPVKMPDGYMWKFMYSIPIALRNKFLTDAYMPVVNALRNQFYSNGNIQTVKLDSGGAGYTYANITVQGDGYRESDPLFLTTVNISNGGSGYSSGATFSAEPPFAGTNSWIASTVVLLGQKVSHNNNIYQVEIPGVLGSIAPTHRSDVVANGTAALRYIGTTITGNVVVSSGVVTGVDLLGGVREVNITSSGSGYTAAPTVTFVGGGGTGAIGTAIINGTSISKVIIYDMGQDYTSAPTVVFGTQWQATTSYSVGQQIFYSNRLYTVTVAGTTGSTAPTHTSGSATNGSCTLSYVGQPATGSCALKYGSGYSAAPAVTIQPVSGGSGATAYMSAVKSEAKLIPIISGGALVGVQIDDPGIGYTYANINVTGDGTGALLSADLSTGDVNTLQANTELLTIDGRIMAYPIVSGGFGYASATVTIDGDGTGAAAEAVIQQGRLVKINVTNYGQGYRWAKVTITGNGYGAKARAVMAPIGGHGKNAIDGLFARTLMFYTNISRDKNQGFEVNNDYRQIGIIKNPSQYGNTYSLKSAIASACWVVTGSINTTKFTKDMVVTIPSNGRRFRIVSLNSTSALLQSLDNYAPSVGTVFMNSATDTFSAAGVTAPTADKYSGDMLFIDNKQAFTPTEDQTVTLRTVIKF